MTTPNGITIAPGTPAQRVRRHRKTAVRMARNVFTTAPTDIRRSRCHQPRRIKSCSHGYQLMLSQLPTAHSLNVIRFEIAGDRRLTSARNAVDDHCRAGFYDIRKVYVVFSAVQVRTVSRDGSAPATWPRLSAVGAWEMPSLHGSLSSQNGISVLFLSRRACIVPSRFNRIRAVAGIHRPASTISQQIARAQIRRKASAAARRSTAQ